jgi:hypothetical protein
MICSLLKNNAIKDDIKKGRKNVGYDEIGDRYGIRAIAAEDRGRDTHAPALEARRCRSNT